MFNAHRLLPTYKFNFHFKSTSEVVYVCGEIEFKEVASQPDRQTDRLATRTHGQADEQDRQEMVPLEMQMSKLLAAILHIRHQSVAAAPLAAVLWGRELWLFKIIIF